MWGRLSAAAVQRGRPRPINDMWIAACCLTYPFQLANWLVAAQTKGDWPAIAWSASCRTIDPAAARTTSGAQQGQAPKSPPRRLLHGTRLHARRGALERPSQLARIRCSPPSRGSSTTRPQNPAGSGSPGLIPSVIGLTSDDHGSTRGSPCGAAAMALPVVSAERQRVMAVSVLACERVLAELDGRAPAMAGSRSPAGRPSLRPRTPWSGRRRLHRRARAVVEGISAARRTDHRRSGRAGHRAGLRVRIRTRCSMTCWSAAMNKCRAWARRDQIRRTTLDSGRWADACRLTGVGAGRSAS